MYYTTVLAHLASPFVGVAMRFISAYPLLSAYCRSVYRYKRMRLLTRVYGMPAQKVAYSMSGNKIGSRAFVGLSAAIQAGARGSGDGNKSLEKLLSSYLKDTKNAK
jgi:hypothetical protein